MLANEEALIEVELAELKAAEVRAFAKEEALAAEQRQAELDAVSTKVQPGIENEATHPIFISNNPNVFLHVCMCVSRAQPPLCFACHVTGVIDAARFRCHLSGRQSFFWRGGG